ncbi:MAG: DUF3592 domain-containing protein, partial [Phycisphaerales bacterium]|nr:DUF3592 domain-containing protein [Phycisphaerales bacterium]
MARSWEASGSDDWPAFQATIQDVQAVDESDLFSDESWMPRITYAYEADGAPHTGNRFSFHNPNAGLAKSEATLLANQFTVGESIEVYVDPNDPSRSTMIRGHDEVLGGFVIDLLLVGIGLVMLWGAISDHLTARSQPQS